MEGTRFQKLRLLAGVPNCGNLIVFGFALAHWHNMQGMQVRHFFFALQGQTTWLRQNIVRKRYSTRYPEVIAGAGWLFPQYGNFGFDPSPPLKNHQLRL